MQFSFSLFGLFRLFGNSRMVKNGMKYKRWKDHAVLYILQYKIAVALTIFNKFYGSVILTLFILHQFNCVAVFPLSLCPFFMFLFVYNCCFVWTSMSLEVRQELRVENYCFVLFLTFIQFLLLVLILAI